jgi:hypothetical protein
MFIISSGLLVIGIILGAYFKNSGISLMFFLQYGIFLILFISLFIFFNFKARKIVRTRYGIDTKKFLWKTEAFINYQDELFEKQLVSFNFLNEEKIGFLIKVLEKEIERRKPRTYIASGVYLALLLPLWSQFLSLVYKHIGLEKLNLFNGLLLLMLIGTVSSVCAFMLSKYKSMLNEILDMITSDTQILRDIIIDLESCLFKIKSTS